MASCEPLEEAVVKKEVPTSDKTCTSRQEKKKRKERGQKERRGHHGGTTRKEPWEWRPPLKEGRERPEDLARGAREAQP